MEKNINTKKEKMPAFDFFAEVFESPKHAIGQRVIVPEELAGKRFYLNSRKEKQISPVDETEVSVQQKNWTIVPAVVEQNNENFIFPVPGIESFCANSADWLCYIDKKGKPQIVANFVPRIEAVRICLNETGGESTREYDLSVRIGGRDLCSVVRVKALTDAAKEIENQIPVATLGTECTSVNRKIQNFLRQGMASAAVIRVITEPGWNAVDGGHYFVTRGRDLAPFAIKNDVKKALEYDPRYSMCHSERTLHLVHKISADRRVGAICLLFSFQGVLFRLFKEAGFPIQYLLFLTGTTGSLKTSMAKAIFMHYDSDRVKSPRSFRDTKASFEHGLKEGKDTIAIFDDYYPGTTVQEQNELREKMETLVRFVGDSIGKNRSNSKLENVEGEAAKGVVVVTGENRITGQSANLRCLNVTIKKGTIDKQKLAILQAHGAMISTMIHEFTMFVEENYEMLVKKIRAEFPYKRGRYASLFTESRLADCGATFALTAEILGDFLSRYCKYQDEFCAEMVNGLIEDVEAILCQNEEDAKTGNTALCYGEAISRLLSAGDLRIGTRQECFSAMARFDGFLEGGFLFLNSDVIYEKFRLLQMKAGIQVIPAKTVCQRQLDELGLLEKQSNGQNCTYTVKLGPAGMRQRFLKIFIEKFKKIF